jgi:transposase
LHVVIIRSLKEEGSFYPKVLRGKLTVNHQIQLCLFLEDMLHVETQKAKVDAAIKSLFTEKQKQIMEKLDKVEGIAMESAEVIMAEMGLSIESFNNEDSAVKYAGFAPGVHESSDKKIIVKCHPGNKYLRTAMIQIAWAAVKNKNGYWGAVYQNLKKSRGSKKAIIAVARRLVKVIYKILVNDHHYQKWDAAKYYDNRAKVIFYRKAV